ncbi:hypothetical protein GCM10009539_03860 [Cryptosporangium japonicum]|uniref:Uncharacterized protein n=1 Tax=Cryptosporangium japonicum TaxID=80872 RepID=A0ABN0THN9_9ACTN
MPRPGIFSRVSTIVHQSYVRIAIDMSQRVSAWLIALARRPSRQTRIVNVPWATKIHCGPAEMASLAHGSGTDGQDAPPVGAFYRCGDGCLRAAFTTGEPAGRRHQTSPQG